MSINEFIGYLHSGNSGNWNTDLDKLTITLDYDPHYCQYFEKHASTWNLEFSDWLVKEMGSVSSIRMDGNVGAQTGLKIQIPEGIGKHTIEVSF